MTSSRIWRHLLLVFVALTLIALKGWCEIGLPFPPESGAERYLPQILHLMQDGQAINTICADSSGSYLFDHLTVFLMEEPDYPSMALVLFGYQAVALLAFALVLAAYPARGFATTLGLAALLLIASTAQSFGRPETLAHLWTALGLLVFVHTRGLARNIVAGVTFLLVVATSWMAGGVLLLLGAAYLLFRDLHKPAPEIGLAMALNLLGFALIASGPLVETSALRIYTNRGLDRAEATLLLAQIMEEYPGRIDFTPALFSLTTQPRGVCLTGADFLPDGSIHSQAELVLIQQIRPHKELPPGFRNYRLIRNYFGSYRPGKGCIRFAESPRVYNFAVYQRIDFTTK